MGFQIRKAERRKARLRLGMIGASGSGKTLSSLLIAYGLVGDWSKIGLIDTEQGSGELYVGTEISGVKIGEYMYGRITPPFEVSRYLEAVHALEQAGAEVIIVDSLSHAWAGEGGLLDKQGKIADRIKNSYTAWREVTPEHNQLVEVMLQSSSHIIACLRAKTEYALEETDKGKKAPKKVGMAPIQRDGLEYEFTVVLDLDQKHTASSSKDRTGMFDGRYFTPGPDTGKELLAWLEMGTDAPSPDAQFNSRQGNGRADDSDREAKQPEPLDMEAAVKAIEQAQDLDELKRAFAKHYLAAQREQNEEALATLTSLKDTRKDQLQEEGATRTKNPTKGRKQNRQQALQRAG